MNKVLKYILAYGMWFANLGLSAWLFYISRTAIIALFAAFYQAGDYQYAKTVDLVDRIFTILLGLGWLVLSMVTEESYRTGALKVGLLKRFARFTGPLLLCIFVVDLFLFWLQGVGGDNWLRWSVLAIELLLGLALFVFGRISDTNKTD
jgi:hypothetical protein